jgi:hypothetical protein
MQKYDSITVNDIRVINPTGLYYPPGYIAITTPDTHKTTWKPAKEAIGTPVVNCHSLLYSASFAPPENATGKSNNIHRNLCINSLNANSNKGNLLDKTTTPQNQINTREIMESKEGKFVITTPGRYRIKARWRGALGNTTTNLTNSNSFTPINIKMLKNNKEICKRAIPLECADT